MAGTVHGFSYPVRDVEENVALRFAGRKGEGVNIALLHCNVGGRKGHENYAPCSLDDLRAAGMDYWALGHVHGSEVLCRDPLVVYPGTIQGRNIRETGKKGVFYVTLSAGEPGCAEFVPCDVVRWRSGDISIDGMERDEEFFQAVSDLKETVGGGKRQAAGPSAAFHFRPGEDPRTPPPPGFLRGPGGLLETVNEGEEDRPIHLHRGNFRGDGPPPGS